MSLGAHWVSIFRIRPHLPLLIDYLISIDSKLPILVKGLSLSKTYHSLAFLFFSKLAASFVVFGVYLLLHYDGDNTLWRVTLVAHNFVSLTCELQLLIFILMIKSRFQVVNRALSSMCHDMRSARISVKSRKILYPKIEKSSDLHHIELAHDCYLKLVDSWILLNKIYAVQVLFSTGGCFLKALFNVYFLSSSSIDDWPVLQNDLINSVVWMVFYFSRFAMLALVATSASHEFAKTKAITALMSHWYDDSTIREELDIFWTNTSCRKLKFSTCGLFTLDSGLIIKACVTGITYLVLLVQFKPQIAVN
uniref:Gustatory receptor n=1 Tax=Apolygus lucorum TaxID=248454 RepID=A0A7S5KKF0_APOLU|nr:gustatory receptor 28a [Apolygus lucorum]